MRGWVGEVLFSYRCARRDGGRAGRRAGVARIDEKKGEHPVCIFFIDACDGMAGGWLGGRMPRTSIEQKRRASTLDSIFRPYMNHIFPEHARLFPVLAGAGRRWPVLAGFVAVLSQKRSDLTPPTRAGGQDDSS